MFKTNTPTYRVITIVGGAAFCAVHAGEKNFDFATPSTKQILGIATANSTTTTTGSFVVMNTTNFATVTITPPQARDLVKSSS